MCEFATLHLTCEPPVKALARLNERVGVATMHIQVNLWSSRTLNEVFKICPDTSVAMKAYIKKLRDENENERA
jgi:hypothetical protein